MNPDPMNLWSDDYLDGDSKRTNHLVHENVEFVRLQFRRPGTGEWISAWNSTADKNTDSADLQCSNARGEGCSFEWDLENQYFLNGLKDGPWEIRSKVFCSGYDSFATSDVRGSVTDENLSMIADVTSPYPSSHEMYGNVLFVDFSEEITCPQLSSSDMAYSITRTADCDGNSVSDGAVSEAVILSHYTFRCLTHDSNGRNSWTMSVPISTAASSYADAGEYTVTINDGFIEDAGGNTAASFTITESFGCSLTSSSYATASKSSSASSEVTSSSQAHLGSAKTIEQDSSRIGSSVRPRAQDIVLGLLAGVLLTNLAQRVFSTYKKVALTYSGEADTIFYSKDNTNDDNDDVLIPLRKESDARVRNEPYGSF